MSIDTETLEEITLNQTPSSEEIEYSKAQEALSKMEEIFSRAENPQTLQLRPLKDAHQTFDQFFDALPKKYTVEKCESFRIHISFSLNFLFSLWKDFSGCFHKIQDCFSNKDNGHSKELSQFLTRVILPHYNSSNNSLNCDKSILPFSLDHVPLLCDFFRQRTTFLSEKEKIWEDREYFLYFIRQLQQYLPLLVSEEKTPPVISQLEQTHESIFSILEKQEKEIVADIQRALDDLKPAILNHPEVEDARELTHFWAERQRTFCNINGILREKFNFLFRNKRNLSSEMQNSLYKNFEFPENRSLSGATERIPVSHVLEAFGYFADFLKSLPIYDSPNFVYEHVEINAARGKRAFQIMQDWVQSLADSSST